jgi:hypothetical protein
MVQPAGVIGHIGNEAVRAPKVLRGIMGVRMTLPPPELWLSGSGGKSARGGDRSNDWGDGSRQPFTGDHAPKKLKDSVLRC